MKRRSPPSLMRMLTAPLGALGFLALVYSAMRIRYDDPWAMSYAALHVLVMIGLMLQIGWIQEPDGMIGVVFGRPRHKVEVKEYDDLLE